MPYNDKTMNPMKHNGKPQINDEGTDFLIFAKVTFPNKISTPWTKDTPLKSTPLKQFLIQQPVQTGDSGKIGRILYRNLFI